MTTLTASLCYVAGLQTINVVERKAIFYLINTNKNGNGWAVSNLGLEVSLPTVVGKPLGLGKNHTPGHFDTKNSINIGSFVAHENKGNYALGTAKIDDEKTLKMLQESKLGPVSVWIQAHAAHCSSCFKEIEQLTQDYSCPYCREGHTVVDSFVFNRVDFVNVPAYPQAGFLNFVASKQPENQSNTSSSVDLPLLATAYECSQIQQKIKNKPVEGEDEKIMDENQKQFEKLSADVAAQISAVRAENQKRYEELAARLTVMETGEQTDLVSQALTLRKQAGITTDENLYKEVIMKASKDTLRILIDDAKRSLAARQTQANPQQTNLNPSGEEQKPTLNAAMQKTIADMGLTFEETKA
ncbi:MAG: hypothetical protein FWG55_05865 [Candidatus Bathyarchaeota archaeon]|nr:hypothetical protein [Candidatus Termiticorpusculum sp.]